MLKALAGNQDLAKADATLKETKAYEDEASAARWPWLDAKAGYDREKINLTAFGFNPAAFGISSPTINLYTLGGAIAYNLDIFGARSRHIESAKAQTEAEFHRSQAAYLTLTGRVAQQAILIASLRAQMDAANAVVKDDQANLDIVKRAEKAGGTPQAEITTAETQLERDQADVPPIAQRLAQARHGLALLVGETPAAWAPPDFDLAQFHAPAQVPVSLPSELVRLRPDILASTASLHSALADIGVAEAARLPKISLNASMTQGAVTTANLFRDNGSGWDLGAGIAVPLFHGGALSADKRAKEAIAKEMLASYRQTVIEAFVQIADVLEALVHDQERLDALSRAEASAAKNLQNARVGFEKGGWPFINVLDAQRLHNQALQDLAAAQGQRLSDIALLYVATAANWQDAASPTKAASN
jgi:NodT family efflux transporter outer membrane factor (OMF) lipoprotein